MRLCLPFQLGFLIGLLYVACMHPGLHIVACWTSTGGAADLVAAYTHELAAALQRKQHASCTC